MSATPEIFFSLLLLTSIHYCHHDRFSNSKSYGYYTHFANNIESIFSKIKKLPNFRIIMIHELFWVFRSYIVLFFFFFKKKLFCFCCLFVTHLSWRIIRVISTQRLIYSSCSRIRSLSVKTISRSTVHPASQMFQISGTVSTVHCQRSRFRYISCRSVRSNSSVM